MHVDEASPHDHLLMQMYFENHATQYKNVLLMDLCNCCHKVL